MKSYLEEEWRKIPGLPEQFEVSNKGNLRSLPYIDKRGWKRKTILYKINNAEIILRINGKNKWFALAALVLSAFIGPKPKGCRLSRHLDDDRNNNYVENLKWGTDKENIEDAIRNGYDYKTYGHLGKSHSEETKEILRNQRKGISTGRKITDKHREALLTGFRKKYPESQKESIQCKCGCGNMTSPGKQFLQGHYNRRGIE